MKKWDETIILVRTGVVVFFSEKARRFTVWF